MKLTTAKGQLDLPRDFAMTMRRTNPFLSDDGDASLPCTLPASPNNLQVLGHSERIDSNKRHMNKIAASLQCGPVSKNGQLIIDTLNRQDGIAVSFAIENSDLYSQFKDKTLKEIFREYDSGAGYKRTDYNTVSGWMTYLNGIFSGSITTETDLTIFPVAIAPYKENDVTHYQANNEYSGGLVWQKRTVREGDIAMLVPDGYGISPFLYLHRMIARLFEAIGYKVVTNCFSSSPYSGIVVLNNGSDTLVKPVLNYADLVPNCKVSEFLDFLLKKFHAQAKIDSTAKTVSIVLMEDLISATPASDITDMVNGDLTMAVAPSSRVVLSSKTDIEGAEASEETFDKLMEKYDFFVALNDDEYAKIGTAQQAYFDCLILRKATGEFFALERSMSSGAQTKRRLGTNYFRYDRRNAEETEQFDADDSMPPMVDFAKTVIPFIGERRHFHTSYLGSETDTDQDIIVVQEYKNIAGTTLPRGGTTQKHVPLDYSQAHAYEYTLPLALHPYELYKQFWKKYNGLMLNYKVTLTGIVEYPLAELMNLDMVSPKLYRNQVLIPVESESTFSGKVSNGESSFILAKTFADGVTDTDINPGQVVRLKWRWDDNMSEFVAQWWEANEARIEAQLTQTEGEPIERLRLESYTFSFTDNMPDAYIGQPIEAGQTSATVVRRANIVLHMTYMIERTQEKKNWSEQILDQQVSVSFTATAY